MWRFFRLGFKSNTCSGNQTHFRIIGTTCANADSDEKTEDITNFLLYKETYNDHPEVHLAYRAAAEHHNFLKQQKKLHFITTCPDEYQHDKLETLDRSIKEIYWETYFKQRIKIFSNQNKERNHKQRSITFLTKPHVDLKSKDECMTQNQFTCISEEPFGAFARTVNHFEQNEGGEHFCDKYEELKNPNSYAERLTPHEYGRKMLAFCKEKKLKEAISVLEDEMKSQNVLPDNYCYNVLITACGKAGYMQKAFSLYNQMKRRGLKVEKFAYTGLFNACANSPYAKFEGLDLSKQLRDELKDKEINLHPITYHAMIKAFGHCGDIKTAFEVADEMLKNNHNITTQTLNFLLQACISDRDSGFRHALKVWQKMRALNMSPDIFSYNLFLRCAKECGAGDHSLLSDLLDTPVKERIPQKVVRKSMIKKKVCTPTSIMNWSVEGNSPVDNADDEIHESPNQKVAAVFHISESNEVEKVDLAENMELEIISTGDSAKFDVNNKAILPILLSRKFHPGKITKISGLERKEDRLTLVGGVAGVFRAMNEDGVKPTITTLTYLLECLPSSKEAEQSLLSALNACKLVPDVIFCNKLILRRCLRNCLEEAKEILDLMQKHSVFLDLATFGCLSIGCKRPSQMRTLLSDMDKAGFEPSEEIITSLLRNSVYGYEFRYTIELLGQMKKLEMLVTERILELLEEGRNKARKQMIDYEKQGERRSLTSKEKKKREEIKLFLMEYQNFLKKSKVELKDHPWAQYGYQDYSKSQVVKTQLINCENAMI